MKLRSREWFEGKLDNTFEHNSAMRAMGHVPDSYVGKPIIGIANSWSDFNSCNEPHKEFVEYVKRGILLEGGYPMEFHTITAPADLMKPSDLIYRNLMAMDVEESIRSQPVDGVVLLFECDKTGPAQVMGATSCNLPAIAFSAGHRASGHLEGRRVTYATDLWKYIDEYEAGTIDRSVINELERCISCSLGGCAVMGTASTVKLLLEMLGLSLPGTATLPATDSRRKQAAEMTGRTIVKMVRDDIKPSDLITEESVDNAIRLLSCIGGSTNAIIHLTAMVGRLGRRLDLQRFQEVGKGVPLMLNVQPNGPYNMDDVVRAGGSEALFSAIMPVLNGDCLTCTGRTIADVYKAYRKYDDDVIRSLDKPLAKEGGIAVLEGNLAPRGAVIKRSAASSALMKHSGQAVVFENYEDMLNRINRDDLEVDENSVLVMRHCGPVACGMPEWGSIPVPRKLLRKGVRDIVRISDARMSGTSFGTIVLHAAPEAAVGGPLGLVQTGDWIELDVDAGKLELKVDAEELKRRERAHRPYEPNFRRGFMRLHEREILQADEGCDLGFLRPETPEDAVLVPPVVGRG